VSQLIRKPPGQEPVGRPPEIPSDAEPPYRWRTFFIWAAGIVLLFGVLIALRDLHIFPRPAGDDPEIVAAKATQQALPTTASTSAPLAASAAQPINTAIPTSASASAATAPTTGSIGAVAPGATVGTLGGTSGQDGSTPAPAIDPTLAAEVLQAYQSYWTVRVHAMAEPTNTDIALDSVMADVELATAQKTLADYRSEGKAYRTSVEHHAQPMSITATEAVILDQYVGTSVKLDPATGEPLAGAPTVEHYKDVFVLRPVGGVWKVVDEHVEG